MQTFPENRVKRICKTVSSYYRFPCYWKFLYVSPCLCILAARALSNGHIRPRSCSIFATRAVASFWTITYAHVKRQARNTRLGLSRVTTDPAIILPALTSAFVEINFRRRVVKFSRGMLRAFRESAVATFFTSWSTSQAPPDCACCTVHSYVTPALYHTLRPLLYYFPREAKFTLFFQKFSTKRCVRLIHIICDYVEINSKLYKNTENHENKKIAQNWKLSQ